MKSQYKWALAAASVLAVGFASVQQTGALWRSDANLPGATLTAGKLDISAGVEGVKAFDLSGFGMTNMAPGDSVQKALPVYNSGNVGMSYQLQQVALNGANAPALNLRVAVVGSQSDCAASGDPGTQLYSGTMAQASFAARHVDPGASQVLCLKATAPQNAPAGQSGTATFTFQAAVDR
ncbi:hypothetical protein G4X40_10475 [Rhodococcus sp. D2-41]|uniref:Ribosomally synthesized peptide with SipW-like signal peptide n=1 Tax=Speluncibacter jeojiensis TaxID=2710754 RepID=A0A9X4LZ67_9ACTN|nr:hypothetical protein [Rhodococcus sp. D2-41]MDG3010573.1 hypothetical protein [Rhodococcus sp. D2-41]MDG3014321.1 hypothetical protein [Corynebacteriales bacterium D3-21]